MTDTTLHELLSGLSRDPSARADFEADPDGYLSAHGFDLSLELVGEAIVSVVATLPPEVAEHLAPFTIAQSPIPPIEDEAGGGEIGVAGGLGLLATAPVVVSTSAEPVDGDTVPDVDGFGEGAADGSAGEPLDASWLDSLDEPGLDEVGRDEVGRDDLHDSTDDLGAGGDPTAGATDSDAQADEADPGPLEADLLEDADPAGLDDLDGFE